MLGSLPASGCSHPTKRIQRLRQYINALERLTGTDTFFHIFLSGPQAGATVNTPYLVVELAPLALHLVEQGSLASDVVLGPDGVELLHDVLGRLVPGGKDGGSKDHEGKAKRPMLNKDTHLSCNVHIPLCVRLVAELHLPPSSAMQWQQRCRRKQHDAAAAG